MNYGKLEKNITEMIEEQQLKLGFLKETVRLYYPLSSLNRFLETEGGIEEMKKCLQEFGRVVRARFGEIMVSNEGERFCIAVPPQGAEYIHRHLDKNGFLAELIRTVERYGCTVDEVLALFYRYSDDVHVEQGKNEEFDYLVYFENGIPDGFRYCVKAEGGHVIYHRYTPEDYEEFGF
ncbi:MAG: DUF3877 family protein [Bacteroidales bacterium]|nr:DUF3877 family protein [Clostridium sp.]MCM1202847.1 DUF3877 family protein [Bacteroidales bacterium]